MALVWRVVRQGRIAAVGGEAAAVSGVAAESVSRLWMVV
jgi:hypothetical protein